MVDHTIVFNEKIRELNIRVTHGDALPIERKGAEGALFEGVSLLMKHCAVLERHRATQTHTEACIAFAVAKACWFLRSVHKFGGQQPETRLLVALNKP